MAKKIKRKVKTVRARKVQKLVKSKPSKRSNPIKIVLGVFALVFFLGSLGFFSSSVTGNVIGSGSSSTASIVGVYLFIWGLLMAAMFLKENK